MNDTDLLDAMEQYYAAELIQGPALTDPQLAARFIDSVIKDKGREHMGVLLLDQRNRLIKSQILNVGTVNKCVLYRRELAKACLFNDSCAIILFHNHPSNHLKPSETDIRVTKLVSEMCKALDIRFLDHLIVGFRGDYYSFQEEGCL